MSLLQNRLTVYISIFLLLADCSVSRRTNTTINEDGFVDFENAQSVIKADSEIIPDQLFQIKLVKGWNKYVRAISGSFVHKFDYTQSREIIFIYFPGYLNNLKQNKQELNIGYRRFETLCSENGINVEVEKLRIKHSRRFGIKVLNDGHFVAMYLNVPEKQIEMYNYSITSLILK